MHVSVGGSPAKDEVSTDVWQYRQSIPIPLTWCLWLNGTGWLRGTFTSVTYGESLISLATQVMPARIKTAPKTLTRAIVFVLG
jgi:hypothetical protein